MIKGSGKGWNLFLVLGGIMMVATIFLLLINYPRKSAESRRLKEAPVREVDEFNAAGSGADVLLTGVLGGTLTGDLDPLLEGFQGESVIMEELLTQGLLYTFRYGHVYQYVQDQGLLIFREEVWRVTGDTGAEGTRWKGSWKAAGLVAPKVVEIQGQSVPINFSRSVSFSMVSHQSGILVEGSGRVDQGIPDGSMRAVGYKDGDFITIFGRKDTDGALNIEYLHGGSPETLIQELESEARNVRTAGFVSLGVMLLCALLWLLRYH